MQTGPSNPRAGGTNEEGPKLRSTRRPFRSPRRLALGCLKLSALVVCLAVVAAGVLVGRLSMGPIAVDGIGDEISSALHQRFGKDLHFTLGGTSIVQKGFGPSLDIDRLSVAGPDGQSIIDAPKAQISIDPFALIVGKVVPKRLEVFDITLRLVVLKNGDLAIATGNASKPFFEVGRDAGGAAPASLDAVRTPARSETPVPGGTSPRRAEAMKEAAAAIRQLLDALTDPGSKIAAVDRLAISRGTLVIQDQVTNETTTYKGLDLAFDRRHGTTSFDLAADGPNGRWSIDAVASGAPGTERHFALTVHDLSIDELQLALGSRSLGIDSDMPFGAHVDIGLKADNSLSEAVGGFDLGRGFLRVDDPDHEPQLITSLGGEFRWNAAVRSIEVASMHYLDEAGSHFEGSGKVQPPRDEGDPWKIALALDAPGLLAPDRKGQPPIPVSAGSFGGRLLLDQKRFMIDHLSFKTGTGGLAALGQIDWIDGPHIRLGMSLDPVPVSVVKRVWPAFVAAPARAWLLSHFVSGTIKNGRLKIDYVGNDLKRMRADRAPSDSSVALDFAVDDGTVLYLDGVPPVQHVVGVGHITGRTSRFSVTSGQIDANGKPVDLSDGSFSIANANIRPIEAKVTAHLSGSVEAVADILSRDALKPYASIPLDPSTLHGHVDGTLDKTLLLGTDDKSRDALSVEAKVTDFTAEHLLGKEDLSDATVDIAVGDGRLKATGQGKIIGAPVTFEIDRTGFDTPTASLAVTLDDAARAKIGLSAIQGLSGPVVAHVVTPLGDPSKIKAQVDLDLSKASLAAAYLGLVKPAGRPGKVAFTLASGPTHMIIDPIVADIGPFQARGSIDLAPDNSFQAAHFSSFKVSTGDDMKLDVTKADDAFKLTIRGSTIDARPFLKAVTSTPSNESTPLAKSAKAERKEADSFKGFDVDLKSAILTGFNKEVMSGVELKLSKRGSKISQFNVHGNFGSQTVTGSMAAGGKIKLLTTDAGALVSFIDLYKHMESGLLTAAMQMDGDQLSGHLEIHEFILRDEPALRRLVAQSAEVSAPGADAQAARRIDGGAVRFNRLKVNFHRDGSQLELRDAAMSGPDIGLSVEGWLDYSHDRVDMTGTFVPAFALNNLFSQIPVLGVFLGGKSNEGLLAITFQISGLATTPTLTINPLSVVTPGILRNIFGAIVDTRFREGNSPQYTAPSR